MAKKKHRKINLYKLIGSMLVTPPGASDFLSAIIYTIIAVGFVFSASASMKQTTTVSSITWSIGKQVIIVVIGTVFYHLCSVWISDEKYKKWIDALIVLEIAFLLVAYAWSKTLGSDNGSYSWIYLPGISFQPSEIAKIIGVQVIASKLSGLRFHDVKKPWEILFKPLLVLVGFFIIIVILQRDMGTGVVFAAIMCICLLVPNHKLLRGTQLFIIVCLICGGFLYCFFLTDPGVEFLRKFEFLQTVANRFEAVRNPSYYSDGTREIFYSLLGISKGKLKGVGLGDSVQKFGYLVSSDADYIFSIIVEETGLFGIAIVFILYALLMGTLLYYAARVEGESDRVCLVGAVAYLFIHFFFNIGGVSGFIPLTGVPLLLLSRGGSAFLSIMCMLGICQNAISRYNRSHPKARK